MAYATSDDLDIVFGKRNVDAWADINNNRVLSEIDARREWALEQASAELDDKLRTSQYQFPLAVPGSGDAYPPTLVRACCYRAGVLLYDSRGSIDVDEDGNPRHRLTWAKRAFDEFVRDVHGRRIVLDAVLREVALDVVTSPGVVNFPDPATSTNRCENRRVWVDGFFPEE